jgi:hypothetical protein
MTTPLIDDEERQRRLALLKTGVLSDLTLNIGPVTKRLHAAIVSLRCCFLWRWLDPRFTWKDSSRTIDVKLPSALTETDGPWQEAADLDAFFEWVYLAEVPPLALPSTDDDVRRLLRLHRLACFFDSKAIRGAIEDHFNGCILPSIAAQMAAHVGSGDDNVETLRAVLFPALEFLLHACEADPDGRFRLGQLIVQWAFALAPTFFPSVKHADELRRELHSALSPLYFFPRRAGSPLTDPSALVVAVCGDCFTSQKVSGIEENRARLPGDQGWTVVRRGKRARALLCLNARASAVDAQFLDVAAGRLSAPQTLLREAAEGWRSSSMAWYPVAKSPVAADAQGPTGQGCCQQCRKVTHALHVLALRPRTLPSFDVQPRQLPVNIARIG